MATAQDATSVALAECAAQFEQADAAPSPGVQQIEKQCSELKTLLENSPYAAWLPEDWWGPRLTLDSLLELRELIEAESIAREPRTVDGSGVAAALASLGDDAQASEVTWWDRLIEWLRSRLRSDSQQSPNWLFKWLDEIYEHQTALRIAGYCLFALIILSAAWIVFSELRAAGVFGTRWQRRSRSAGTPHSAGPARGLTLADLDGIDLANRPSMLLALLQGALARREDRAVDASVTHRELAARVQLSSDSQRSAFGRLVRCAERVRYAAELPALAEIDEAVRGGRQLLESIAVPAGGSAA